MSRQTYIALVTMTESGKAEITDTFARRETLRPIWDRLSVELVDYYATFGRYDFVMIYTAPSQSAFMEAMMEVGRLGAIQTETLCAVESEDYQRIITSMTV